MLNDCAHRVKDSDVELAEQKLRDFLDFTRCHCFQLFSMSFDKKSLAFQLSKESYLQLGLSFDISFVVPLQFHQFDEELYYVALRTSP